MASLLQTAPTGWNKWIYPKTTLSSTTGNIQLPDASFPYIYTPATSFWIKSYITHCLISWINTYDFLSLFTLGGGFSGTIMGSLGGLGVVAQIGQIGMASGHFSSAGPYPAPRFGFCIDSAFKQQVYTSFDIQNIANSTLLVGQYVERLENSRFKRFYALHGSVVSYTVDTEQTPMVKILTLDIGVDWPAPSVVPFVAKVTIYKLDGSSSEFKITELLPNWDMVVEGSGEFTPEAGDFYVLNRVWKIHDPMMLSGDWIAFEDDLTDDLLPASGENLAITTENLNYSEGKVLGIYLWLPSSAADSTATSSPDAGLPIPNVGSDMSDKQGYGWAFYGLGNTSDIYPDDVRYKEVRLDVPDEETGATVKYLQRDEASGGDYENYIADPNSTYLRIEISKGGWYTRHNWFSPALKGQYIEFDGIYYKILAHVESNIIDVLMIGDDSTMLDVVSSQEYSIFNHFGWMINEDYFQDRGYSTTGIFQGTIMAVSDEDITLELKQPFPVTASLKHGSSDTGAKYSLIDRWDYYFQKFWTSFPSHNYPQTIKFIAGRNPKQFNVSKVVYNDNPDSPTLTISIDKASQQAALKKGQPGYLTADEPYKTISPRTAKDGWTFILKAAGGRTSNATAFVLSDVLCLDGEYMSSPYRIPIPTGARIGICDGYLFGIEANGSAQSRAGALTLVSTPRADRGIASLYNTLRQEDWIAYEDAMTTKTTIRRGSLDFTEYPQKQMVVIGNDALIEDAGDSSPVTLNTDQEWLRKMKIPLPKSGNETGTCAGTEKGVMFGLGSDDNFYGFYVSGDGIVDLQLLRKEGNGPGDVSSVTYHSNTYNQNVSPVYVYKTAAYQELQHEIVDVGVKVKSVESIYLNGASDSSAITAVYANDNQVLGASGYFDLIELTHGEHFLVYGQKVSKFRAAGDLNNSVDNDTLWSDSNAIFIIGTSDEVYTWGAPLEKDINNSIDGSGASPELQYPLMVMNSVDYLASIYDTYNNVLSIFARCYNDASGSTAPTTSANNSGTAYLGCFTLSIMTLRERRFMCRHPDYDAAKESKTPLSFLWRHPSFDDNFILDETQFWTDVGNVIQDGYMFDAAKDPTAAVDRFVRVMGPESTNSQISNADEIGVISTTILPDGAKMVLYDSPAGIRAIFSNDGNGSWMKSDLVYAKTARSGVLIGSLLFYIGPESIMVKRTNYTDFYAGIDIVMKKNAGKDVKDYEKDIQTSLDNMTPKAIGSGVVEPQRLSGYVTHTGIIKIFFYDENNLAKCMVSSDGGDVWKVSSNF